MCALLQSNVTFSTEGCLLHSASDEAAEQAARAEAMQVAAAAAAAEQERAEVREPSLHRVWTSPCPDGQAYGMMTVDECREVDVT